MFGTIRRHQTWLWAVIITLTIISFVIFFSPYSKMNSDRRGPADYGSINGETVTEPQFQQARREVELHHFFMSGRWPEEERNSSFDPLRETYQWLLLCQKQDQMGIHVSTEQVANVARERLKPFERMGITSPAAFVTRVLQPHGLSLDDFERFSRRFLGIQELIATVGLSGKLVTPQEAKQLYERDHQEWATEVAFFSASNYLASVTVNPATLAQFYSNRVANYRIPDRVQVAYVHYNVTNFLPQAEADLKTNLNELVDANYERLGTNYFSDAKTPAEAKAKIRQQLIETRALATARKRALDLANGLEDMLPRTEESFRTVARSNGLPVQITAPFDREDGPKELEVGPDFAKAAFGLKTNEPFAGPIAGQDGVYLIALDKKIPSEIPTFEKVQDQVTADFKHEQALNLAGQSGMVFYSTLTNGLAQGKTFSAICLENKLKPVALPPFSLSTRGLPEAEDRLNLNQLKQAAVTTPPGQVSHLVWPSDAAVMRQLSEPGGFILYVKAKLPLDEAKMQADLPTFVSYVRRNRQEEAFQQWFRKEAERGLKNVPALRQQQPPVMGAVPPAKS
jgi:parvulin-like peptidyl-prolyl isomerase